MRITRVIGPAMYAAVLFSLLAASMARADSEIASVELKALEARRAIERGCVELEYTYRAMSDSRPPASLSKRRAIHFDGEQVRMEECFDYDATRARSHGEQYRTVVCFGESEHIRYSSEITPEGHEIALTVRPLDQVDLDTHAKMDPRLIGMAPRNVADVMCYPLEVIVGRPDRTRTSTESVVLNRDECTLVEYERNDGLIARMWIRAEKDYSVLKVQTESVHRGERYELTTEVSVRRDEASGKWFPERTVFTELRDGERIREEDARVQVVSLNQPLADGTFGLAGIGAPAGKRVNRVPGRPDHRKEYWDGQELVLIDESGGDSAPIAQRGIVRRVILILGTLVLLVVVVVLVNRRSRA